MEVVVSFRSQAGRGFLERARNLEVRARARNGRLVAFDAGGAAFSFPSLHDALHVALAREDSFSVGIAEGMLQRLGDGFGDLAGGLALESAQLLAGVARSGEVVCASHVKALRSGDLLAGARRVAREGERKVLGVLLDSERPWRKQAAAQLSRMRVAPLAGGHPTQTPLKPGNLFVVRADPGAGGSRLLGELAAAAPRALVVSPSGSGYEPLGALRRALGRSITREMNLELLELAVPLETLLRGAGLPLDTAATLVNAYFRSNAEGGILVLDDARVLDPASLEACVRAARSPHATFGVVARLDATTSLPSILSLLAEGDLLELGPLAQDASEELAAGCTNNALDGAARRRWARLGGNLPLGITEAVACGIETGDIAWRGNTASPRTRAAGRGKVRSPAEWIALRASTQPAEARTVLALVALLGGEAKPSRVARILDDRGMRVDVEAVVQRLVAERWLSDTQEDWVALPSRTHRAALSQLLEGDATLALHASAAANIEEEEGAFGRVEAAWHAAQAKDIEHASTLLLDCAKATAASQLDTSTTQIIALARRIDPSCEDAALELLGESLRSMRPALPAERAAPPAPMTKPDPELAPAQDSEPPTIARIGVSEFVVDVPFAHDALLTTDSAALESWVDELAAKPLVAAERTVAFGKLRQGDIGDTLRVLRRTRSELKPNDHKRLAQASLALGVALGMAGRPEEALLEGLDALARARHVNDENGARACLAFLSKLFASVGRVEESERLRGALPLPLSRS